MTILYKTSNEDDPRGILYDDNTEVPENTTYYTITKIPEQDLEKIKTAPRDEVQRILSLYLQ